MELLRRVQLLAEPVPQARAEQLRRFKIFSNSDRTIQVALLDWALHAFGDARGLRVLVGFWIQAFSLRLSSAIAAHNSRCETAFEERGFAGGGQCARGFGESSVS